MFKSRKGHRPSSSRRHSSCLLQMWCHFVHSDAQQKRQMSRIWDRSLGVWQCIPKPVSPRSCFGQVSLKNR
ncbi:hypothetical protein WJX77_010644 [Trebouxia sp. C0004]